MAAQPTYSFPEQTLLTEPILENICQQLSFSELVQLRINSKFRDLSCTVPVTDLRGNVVYLKGVNAETIAAYSYINENYIEYSLKNAITENNIPAIYGLLKSGVSPNIVREDVTDGQSSALHLAAEFGNVPVMKILMEFGGDLNLANDNNVSPIFIAVWESQVEMVKFLLDQGVNPNQIHGLTPWDARSLIEEVANPDHWRDLSDDPDLAAIFAEKMQKNVQILKLLLSYQADPNFSFTLVDNEGQSEVYKSTPLLMVASEGNGNLEMLTLLLEAGANPNIGNKSVAFDGREKEMRPLSSAIWLKYWTLIEPLLIAGADPNFDDNKGYPLFLTVLRHKIKMVIFDIIDLLVKYGADINLKNAQGNTVLGEVLAMGQQYREHIDDSSQLILYLLEKGADCNNSYNGQPLLMMLSEFYPNFVLRRVLQTDVNVNISVNGVFPISILSRKNNSEMVVEFLRKGADPNVYVHKQSLLSYWIRADNLNVVRAILEAGGNVDGIPQRKFNEDLPIFAAIYNGSLDIVQLLVQKGSSLSLTGKDGKVVKAFDEAMLHKQYLIARYLKTIS